MERKRREGLRILLTKEGKQTRKSDAEYAKSYRKNLKKYPEQYAEHCDKNKQRCKQYRSRPLTEEELQARREKGRLRAQKCRDKKKQCAKLDVDNTAAGTTKLQTKPKTRKAVEKQRKKWQQQKQSQREGWTSQKWRRHYERCKNYNSQRRSVPSAGQLSSATVSSAVSATSRTTPTTARSSCERNSTPQKSSKRHDILSPSPRQLKSAYKMKIAALHRKRSKAALASKKLLFDLVGSSTTSGPPADSYKRKERHPASQSAYDFLNDQAVHIPEKRSVSKKDKLQKKILPKRLRRLHRDFSAKNPDKKISLRTFYRLLPKHIVTSRKQTFTQCLCEQCTNVDLKLDSLNRLLSHPIDGRDILSEKSLCPEPTLSCITRKCSQCGIEKCRSNIHSSLQVGLEEPVKWKCWEMVAREKGKRRELVAKEGTVRDLIEDLLKELVPFSQHLFNFRWQYGQFKTIRSVLPPTWALAVMDFSENFLCRYQDEVQSAHWGYNQVMVHPCVLYYKCPNCPEQVIDYLVFVSDDLNHDASMVNVIQEETKQYLGEMVEHLDKVVVFSDGCAAQYKSKLPFHYLAKAAGAVAVERCYFGSRHGKSPCDSCGGVIKRLVEDDILAGYVIQDARTMFEHCSEHYVLSGEPGSCCHTRRSFRLVNTQELDRSLSSSALYTVPGTRQFHSVKGLQRNVLATRKLACFCSACIADKPDECTNKMYVDPWKQVTLKSKQAPDCDTDSDSVCPSSPPPDSPEVPDSTELPPRLQYFADLLEKIGNCTQYQDLENLVRSSRISSYPLPETLPTTMLDVAGASVDAAAQNLRPDSVPEHLYPVQTTPDGNCSPNSVSIVLFGNELHQKEVRCRIVAEMVTNRERYVEGHGMGGMDVAAKVAETAENSGLQSATAGRSEIDTVLKAEIMSVGKNGQYMGLWQIAAAANILCMPVQSHYPQLGWPEFQEMNNRVVFPLHQQKNSSIHIMWTSTRTDMLDSHWIPNHFVPLMPLVDSEAPVSVEVDGDTDAPVSESCTPAEPNEFYKVVWEGLQFIAQIQEVDSASDTVKLGFMECKRGLYTWPVQEDISWENVSALIEKVELEIDEACSNQRQLFFKLK